MPRASSRLCRARSERCRGLEGCPMRPGSVPFSRFLLFFLLGSVGLLALEAGLGMEDSLGDPGFF